MGAGRATHQPGKSAMLQRQLQMKAPRPWACSPLPLSLPAGLAHSSCPLHCPSGGGAGMSFLMGKPPGPGVRRERDWHPWRHGTRAFGSGAVGIPSNVERKARGKPPFGAQPSIGPGAHPTSAPLLVPPWAPSTPSGPGAPLPPWGYSPPPGGGAGRSQIRLCPLASPRELSELPTRPVPSGGLAVELSKMLPGLKALVCWRET